MKRLCAALTVGLLLVLIIGAVRFNTTAQVSSPYPLGFRPSSADPATTVGGHVIYRSDTGAFKGYNAVTHAWVTFATGGGAGASYGVWSVGVPISTGNIVSGSSTLYSSFTYLPSTSSALTAGNFNATESNKQMLTPVAVTLSNFCVVTNTAQPGDGSLVYTVRDNGADTGITITVAAGGGAGTSCDNTHTASVSAGHFISFSVVNNSASASASTAQWAIAYR